MHPDSSLHNFLKQNNLLSPIDKLVYFLSFLAALFDPKSRLTHISETIIEDTVQNLLPDFISILDTDEIQSLESNNQELSLILNTIKNINPKISKKNDILNYLTQSIIRVFPSTKSNPKPEKQIAQRLRLLTAKLILENHKHLTPSQQLEILNRYLEENSYSPEIKYQIISSWNYYQQHSSPDFSDHANFLFDAFFRETTNLGLSLFQQTLNVNDNIPDLFDFNENLLKDWF